MTELPNNVHAEIKRLSSCGDDLAQKGDFGAALGAYWNAWDLLPEPRTDWEAATWLLAAIGDANFLGGDFSAGRDNLGLAMHCPGAIGNPFIHLRLGQCQLELGAEMSAVDELMRAYMGAGMEIFADQNPKYIEFLRGKADGIEPSKKAWQFWK